MFDRPDPIPSKNNLARDLAHPPYPTGIPEDETGLNELDQRLHRIERLELCLDRITNHLMALTLNREISKAETQNLLDKTRIATSTIRGYQHLTAMRYADHDRTIAEREKAKKIRQQKDGEKKVAKAVEKVAAPRDSTKIKKISTATPASPMDDPQVKKILGEIDKTRTLLDGMKTPLHPASPEPDQACSQ
jgi:hypothetical protein